MLPFTDSVEMQCYICYESEDTIIASECCSSAYHKECLDKWTRLKKTCPYCRRLVKATTSASVIDCYSDPSEYFDHLSRLDGNTVFGTLVVSGELVTSGYLNGSLVISGSLSI